MARPTSAGPSKALSPRLPRFKAYADMDAYIERLERHFVSHGWKKESWAMSLSYLPTGKGLEVYTSISPDEVCAKKALNTVIRKRHKLTAERF